MVRLASGCDHSVVTAVVPRAAGIRMSGEVIDPEFDWHAASHAGRDGWVARFVTGRDGAPPNYTTSPTAEYELLVMIRETWPPDEVSAFADVLWQTYEARHTAALAGMDDPLFFLDTLPVLHHQTGDYAYAAYLTRTGRPRTAGET